MPYGIIHVALRNCLLPYTRYMDTSGNFLSIVPQPDYVKVYFHINKWEI